MAQSHVEFSVPEEALVTDPARADRYVGSYEFSYYDPFAGAEAIPLSPERKAILATALHGAMLADMPLTDDVTGHPAVIALADAVRAEQVSWVSPYPPNEDPSTGAPGVPRTALPLIKQSDKSTIDVLEQLLRSEIGLLFLDRTRITPRGFALGEHLFSLSLAPAEEVTIEQKTFSQRETTFEETQELEDTSEQEFSSTLTTELQNSLSRQQSVSATETTSLSATVGFDFGINVSITGGMSTSATQADTRTRQLSAKRATNETRKIAAKFRSQHKTVFRVGATERFETTSKRVFRNPNEHTAIDLVYFKIMQRIELAQERYGVRLAWIPFVRDPAYDFYKREEDYLTLLREEERRKISRPDKPPEPKAPGMPGPVTQGLVPPQVELTRWGFWGDMRADYDLGIPIPSGYVWDGDRRFLEDNLGSIVTGPAHEYGLNLVGNPWAIEDENGNQYLKVRIHAGVDWGGAGMRLYVTLSGRFIPDVEAADAAHQERLRQYHDDVKRWNTASADAEAQAEKTASERFAVWQDEHRRTLQPRTELFRRFVRSLFPPDARDEIHELDMWQEIFDWEHSGFRLYPGTWTDVEPREPERDPADFANASWARLFLPIRLGQEGLALQWIFDRRRGKPSREVVALTGKILPDLDEFRRTSFGDRLEIQLDAADGADCPEYVSRMLCLARWEEVLPTDGTHVEVLQATTTAADETTRAQLDAAAKLRAAAVVTAERDNALRQKAEGQLTQPGSPDVSIRLGEPE